MHGPAPEKGSISLNTPTMASGMFPWDLEDSCWLLNDKENKLWFVVSFLGLFKNKCLIMFTYCDFNYRKLSKPQLYLYMCVGRRWSTWSSQLTPGYLPDWICSSSHGLSLSRPCCCMLQSVLQVSGKGSQYKSRSFSNNRKFLRSSD